MNERAPTKSKRNSRERGEAELMFFGVVLVICGIVSGGLLILNWVKDTKNAKVDDARSAHLARLVPTPFSTRPDPGAYWAKCDKAPWALTQTTIGCEVLPESYGEIYLLPELTD